MRNFAVLFTVVIFTAGCGGGGGIAPVSDYSPVEAAVPPANIVLPVNAVQPPAQMISGISDATPPEMTVAVDPSVITDGTTGSTIRVRFVGSASDEAGVVSFYIISNGLIPGRYNLNPDGEVLEIWFRKPPPGEYELNFIARDRNGNQSQQTRVIKVI